MDNKTVKLIELDNELNDKIVKICNELNCTYTDYVIRALKLSVSLDNLTLEILNTIGKDIKI